MNAAEDRLYRLLPYIYRWRDDQQGRPLQRFLSVVEEQVGVLELDLARSYDNWFIETCEEWVIPYIAELVGQWGATRAWDPQQLQGRGARLRSMLAPRADVARTLAFGRRKGTLPLLEELASAIAGLSARAVEGYRLLSYTQPLKHLRLERGRTLDLRQGDALFRLGTAFDTAAHSVDVRRPGSRHTAGIHSIPSVGVFAWRLGAWPVTRCQPYLQEGAGHFGRGCYWFSVLGRDMPLFVRPDPEATPDTLAGPEHVPSRLTRHVLERDLVDRHPRTGAVSPRPSSQYYGEQRSLAIWLNRGSGLKLVPHDQLIVADLTDWKYVAPEGKVLIDPERGRFKVAGRITEVRVSFHYGFGAAIGGGEYDRQLPEPLEEHRCYFVDERPGSYSTLDKAIIAWRADMQGRREGDASIPPRAIIEIAARGRQTGSFAIELGEGETLIIRGADRNRPVLWLSDDQPEASDALRVSGRATSRFVLDGVLVAQRGIELQGPFDQVVLRHCTLVPPARSQRPREGAPSSLNVADHSGDLLIDSCILGPITISGREPSNVTLRNSIVDAGNDADFALSGDGEGRIARAELTVTASTICGAVATHALKLVENSIFSGVLQVARRQPGCVRFCFVPLGSRTPRRYRCQPDLVLTAASDESDAFRLDEQLRVQPLWTSRRYGEPGYGQLHQRCALEIRRGADDQSELGVLHDQYLPQREELLAERLGDAVPLSTEVGIFFVS